MSLAAALIENGHFRLAESLIRVCLDKTPDDPDLLWQLASLCRAQGEMEACRSVLRRIAGDSGAARKARALLDVLDQHPCAHTIKDEPAPVPFVRMENAVPGDMIERLRRLALDNQHRFHESRVKAEGRVDRKARSAQVWQNVEGLPPGLTDIVVAMLRRQAARLGVQATLGDRLETEISAYRHGDFVAPHWDRGDGITSDRRITTLIYFHANPAPFAGGALQLFDSGTDGRYDRGAWTSFPPNCNTLLQFRSEAIHAVTPVSGPQQFSDSRFCLTFWARAAK